jgi:hypothetical protein
MYVRRTREDQKVSRSSPGYSCRVPTKEEKEIDRSGKRRQAATRSTRDRESIGVRVRVGECPLQREVCKVKL